MPRIHGFESENVAEKYAVRFGVLTVDNDVSTRNHLSLLRKAQNSLEAAGSVEFRKTRSNQHPAQFYVAVLITSVHQKLGSCDSDRPLPSPWRAYSFRQGGFS